MSDALDLDCGIALRRIAGWLDDELGLPFDGEAWTLLEGSHACHVTATPLEARSIATVSIERTRLAAYGDAEAVAAFGKLFTLRFMSAGG